MPGKNYNYYDLKSPDIADRFIELLETKIESLSTFPHRMILTDEEPWRSEGIRKMTANKFLIYFWIDESNST